MEGAQAETKEIVLSFTGEGHSPIYRGENSSVFVYGEYDSVFDRNNTGIQVVPNDEIFDNFIPEDYLALSTYEELTAPLNQGKNVYFTGVPIKQEYTPDHYGITDIVTIEVPGGQIQALLFLDNDPIELQLNAEYVFYGYLYDNELAGYTRLEYVELVDASPAPAQTEAPASGDTAGAETSGSKEDAIDTLVDLINSLENDLETYDVACEYVPDANAICTRFIFTELDAATWLKFDDEARQEGRDIFKDFDDVVREVKDSVPILDDVEMIFTVTTSDGVAMYLSHNGVDLSWTISD